MDISININIFYLFQEISNYAVAFVAIIYIVIANDISSR